jgi:HEAT repeat protein
LTEALGAEDPSIRLKAARTLGCLGEVAGKAAPALTVALEDDDLEVRLAAVKSLWAITKTADVVVPTLVGLLEGEGAADQEDGETRRRFLQTVMEALSRMGQSAAAAGRALIALTKDSNRHIRESAILTLGKIVPPVANKAGVRREADVVEKQAKFRVGRREQQ